MIEVLVIGTIVTLSCATLALSLILIMARKEVKNAPRRDMFLCEKHGPMPVGATITLMDGELDQVAPDGRTVRAPLRSCPICFGTAIKKAKSQ